jgi:hypothetical protein
MDTEVMLTDSLLLSVFLGAVSGILTTALIYVISKMFVDWFLPWYRSFTYEGIDVSGEWETKTEFDSSFENSFMEIKQKANTLDGLLTVIVSDKDSTEKKVGVFTVNGSIKDRFIILTVINNDKKQIGVGTMLIEAVGNGYELEGCETWYSVENKKIKAADIKFRRKK